MDDIKKANPTEEEEEIRIVAGYRFSRRSDATKARKEIENIAKIKDRIDDGNISDMTKLYNGLIKKRYFTTPVGLSFLHEMRAYIMEKNPGVELDYVPVPKLSEKKVRPEETTQYVFLKEDRDRLSEECEAMKKKRPKMIIVIVALIVLVIGMFFIVITNDNLGYVNAENKVLNKYSAWEEELKARERELADWEAQLIEKEEKDGTPENSGGR